MKKSLKIGITTYLCIGLFLGIFYGMHDVYCAEPVDPGYFSFLDDGSNPAISEYSKCIETLTTQKILRGVVVAVAWPLYFVYRYYELGVVYPWELTAVGLSK